MTPSESDTKISPSEREHEVKSPSEREVKSPSEREVKTPAEREVKTPSEREFKTPSEREVKTPSECEVAPSERGVLCKTTNAVTPSWKDRVVIALNGLPNCEGTFTQVAREVKKRWDLDGKINKNFLLLEWRYCLVKAVLTHDKITKTDRTHNDKPIWKCLEHLSEREEECTINRFTGKGTFICPPLTCRGENR